MFPVPVSSMLCSYRLPYAVENISTHRSCVAFVARTIADDAAERLIVLDWEASREDQCIGVMVHDPQHPLVAYRVVLALLIAPSALLTQFQTSVVLACKDFTWEQLSPSIRLDASHM